MALRRDEEGRDEESAEDPSRDRSGSPPDKDARKITADALREAALRYLNTRDASVEQLRRVLQRRVSRYGTGEAKAKALSDVEALLQRFLESKLLDDRRYALGLCRSLSERGASTLKIQGKLLERGLDAALVAEQLRALAEDESLSEDKSARIYAEKKRLRQRYDLSDYAERRKALSVLCRQGFSYDVAQRALDL